jgi:hypothetical protein
MKKLPGAPGISHSLKPELSDFSHFDFSFRFSAAKRLRFDLKERQWLSEMENGVRGHLKTFVH